MTDEAYVIASKVIYGRGKVLGLVAFWFRTASAPWKSSVHVGEDLWRAELLTKS